MSLEECLSYFDELIFLSFSVSFDCSRCLSVSKCCLRYLNNIIQQAEQDAQRLLEEAKYK